MSADPRYSVVVPVYNEEESLLELGRRLAAALDELDGASEVLLVDDAAERVASEAEAGVPELVAPE
jgi:glycosyltransferase involved in cell wall biosynthesis